MGAVRRPGAEVAAANTERGHQRGTDQAAAAAEVATGAGHPGPGRRRRRCR